MKTKTIALAGAAFVLLGALATSHAVGKGSGNGNGNGNGGGGPGGGGDSPAGTIYYLGPIPGSTGPTAITTSISPDGSNPTIMGSGGWARAFGTPSLSLHNHHRWFLGFDRIANEAYPDGYETYPDGSWRFEICAFRDDHDPQSATSGQTRVQLTENATLEPRGAAWLDEDLLISFVGRRWSSTDPGATVVEGGIYTAALEFDADGNITGLAETPTVPDIPMTLAQTADDPEPDVSYYSWNPAGNMIVYTRLSDPYGVWMVDFTGWESLITTEPGHKPEWSPDGRRIAYGVGGGIKSIKPNGKGEKWIIQSNSTWSFYHAFWSPDSEYLVVTGQAPDLNKDLFLVNTGTGELVQLTDTPTPAWETVRAWHGGWR